MQIIRLWPVLPLSSPGLRIVPGGHFPEKQRAAIVQKINQVIFWA
jgi:hypothetical protein